MLVVGTLSKGLLNTFFACSMVIIHGVLTSLITLLVVVGTLSKGLLKTFFGIFYGYYSWVFSQLFNSTLMVVVGTFSKGLLVTFFCVFYGYS